VFRILQHSGNVHNTLLQVYFEEVGL